MNELLSLSQGLRGCVKNKINLF